jgi:PIN domain nuclease of toxin-antitoxin system
MILLDTHVWLWLNGALERIPAPLLEILSDRREEVFFSAVCAWEIGIKHAGGRLSLPDPPETYIPERLKSNGFRSLAIQQRHALRAASLPLHHRDPFDRMLVAQAQLENLRLVTADPLLSRYPVDILWGVAFSGHRPSSWPASYTR